jgi:hypothetical protein
MRELRTFLPFSLEFLGEGVVLGIRRIWGLGVLKVREGGSFVAVSGTGGTLRRWRQGPGLGVS